MQFLNIILSIRIYFSESSYVPQKDPLQMERADEELAKSLEVQSKTATN